MGGILITAGGRRLPVLEFGLEKCTQGSAGSRFFFLFMGPGLAYKHSVAVLFGEASNGMHSDSYTREYAFFNEYMTWSVFVLYVLYISGVWDYVVLKGQMEAFMIECRGFSHFKAFNEKRIELYKNKEPNAFIADLFVELLH